MHVEIRGEEFFCKRIKSETTKEIFGFMSLNWNVTMISDKLKAKDFLEFLRCVRRENGEKKIVMIVDNAKNKEEILKRLES